MNMDSILKAFTISFLLRSVFSGVFFVISYYVTLHNPVDLSKVDGKTLLSLGLPVALFAGVTTYGLHRSLFYPLIECFYDSSRGKTLRKRWPLIRVATIRTLLWRWNADDQPSSKLTRRRQNEKLDTWADFIHLQYASAHCIVFGAVVGRVVVPGEHPPCWPLISLAVLLFAAALVSEWRTRSVLDYIGTKPNTDQALAANK